MKNVYLVIIYTQSAKNWRRRRFKQFNVMEHAINISLALSKLQIVQTKAEANILYDPFKYASEKSAILSNNYRFITLFY